MSLNLEFVNHVHKIQPTLPERALSTAGRAVAEEARAIAITEIAFGLATPVEIIERACLPEHAALLRIRLTKLLRSQVGWGQERTLRTLRKMMAYLDERRTAHPPASKTYATGNDLSHVNIAWLVDARAGGRRVLAFADAINDDRSAPWAGFPLAPKKAQVR